MTSKEKAKELFMKYYSIGRIDNVECAKECANIAANEVCKSTPSLDTFPPNLGKGHWCKEYWADVKKEIELL